MRKYFSVFCLVFLFSIHSAQGEDYISNPGLYSFSADKLNLRGSAYLLDSEPGVVQLTKDLQRQTGAAETPVKFCAKEYIFRSKIVPGHRLDWNSGAGVYMHIVRDTEKNGSATPGPWGEWGYGGKVDDGGYNYQYFTAFDVYKDAADTLTGNDIMFNTIVTDESGAETGIHRTLYEPMPFWMEGGGWMDVSMHHSDGVVKITVSRLGAPVLNRIVSAHAHTGKSFHAVAHAFTGAAYNIFKVKDLSLEIIRSDDCGAVKKLTHDEVEEKLALECGDISTCPDKEEYLACFESVLSELKTSPGIAEGVEDSLTRLISDTFIFCDGYAECKEAIDEKALRREGYELGFKDGVASVDITALEKVAYDSGYGAGVASVDVEAIKISAFNEGKLSVDTNGIREDGYKSGYAEGFSDGVGSVDVEAIKEAAFNEGVVSVDVEALRAEGYTEGFNDGKGSVTCEDPTDKDKKVTICHMAGGDISKAKTLEVSVNALSAHYGHFDTIGACKDVVKKKKSKLKKRRKDKKSRRQKS